MGNRLYVGNLPFSADENQVRELFEQNERNVVEVKIITDRDTGRPRGFGFVEMGSEADAEGAISDLNGYSMDGRPLTVNVARERTQGGGGRRQLVGPLQAPEAEDAVTGRDRDRGREEAAAQVPARKGTRPLPVVRAQMLRRQAMPPGHIANQHTIAKTLGDDPRLLIIRPVPPSRRPLQNLQTF